MGSTSGYKLLKIIGLSAAFSIAGCHGNQPAAAAANPSDQAQQPAQQEQGSSDPASVNLVPAAYGPGTAPANAQEDNTSVPPNAPTSYDGNVSAQPYDDSADESDYGIQPDQTAPDPPPPLPDYDQPQCPGDGYIWTPGYWDYASAGYYWVPGAWVEAPYQGALWTPGYWAYSHNHYAFYHGYWGPHVGFYGGINYGFGYIGLGYQGGYWNRGHFDYNRSVNNINVSQVHNVYNYRIENRSVTRVSYNGGSGGLRLRPQPQELAALREPHAPPMRTQIEIRQSAGANRGQFASANHGRPQQFVASRPVAAEPNVRPVPVRGLRNLPPAAPQMQPHGPLNQSPANRGELNRPGPNHAEPNRPEPNRPEPEGRGLNHVQPGSPQPNRMEPNRPESNRPEQHQPEANDHPEPNHRFSAPPAPNHAAPTQPEPAHTMPERREAPPSQQARPNEPARTQPMPPPQARPNRPMPEQHTAPPQRAMPEQHTAPPQRAMPEQHAPAQHAAPEQHAAPSHAAPEHRQAPPEHRDNKNEHPQ